MANHADYLLTTASQMVAENEGDGQVTCVVTNLTTLATAQFLGDGEAIGEGTAIAASDVVTFELGPGERLFAAAPTADHVSLRVLTLRSA